MALDFIDLFEITKCIKQLTPPLHVLSLGHRTFLPTPETIAPLINNRLLTIDNKRVRKERIGDSQENCVVLLLGFSKTLGAYVIYSRQTRSFWY